MTFTLKTPAEKLDHRIGPLHAPIVVVQYGDYECPYSAHAAPIMEKLVSTYRPNICYVYRHFLMKGIHANSDYAAFAAEAAERQGKFWELHARLFENSSSLSEERIDQLAEESGLNMDLYFKDVDRSEVKERVARDILSAVQNEVTSTPAIYINDLRFEGSTSLEPLKEAVEQALYGGDSAYL